MANLWLKPVWGGGLLLYLTLWLGDASPRGRQTRATFRLLISLILSKLLITLNWSSDHFVGAVKWNRSIRMVGLKLLPGSSSKMTSLYVFLHSSSSLSQQEKQAGRSTITPYSPATDHAHTACSSYSYITSNWPTSISSHKLLNIQSFADNFLILLIFNLLWINLLALFYLVGVKKSRTRRKVLQSEYGRHKCPLLVSLWINICLQQHGFQTKEISWAGASDIIVEF